MQATHHNSAIKYIIVYCDSTTHVVGRGGILELARRLLARVLVCASTIYYIRIRVVRERRCGKGGPGDRVFARRSPAFMVMAVGGQDSTRESRIKRKGKNAIERVM